jgi:hypothetical protein
VIVCALGGTTHDATRRAHDQRHGPDRLPGIEADLKTFAVHQMHGTCYGTPLSILDGCR